MADAIEDFDKAIVLSGVNSSTKPSDVDIPMIGYVGTREDERYNKYMNELEKQVGEGSVTSVNATHGQVVSVSYNLDENNNGISDMLEFAFSDNGKVVEEVQQNKKVTTDTSSTKTTTTTTRTTTTTSTPTITTTRTTTTTTPTRTPTIPTRTTTPTTSTRTNTRTTTPTRITTTGYSRTTTMNIILDLAKELGINTNGKTQREILEEIAKKYNIDIKASTTKTEGGWGETPWIDQLDYLYVGTGLCGVTSLCMLASAALGYVYTPEDLFRDFPDIEKYRDDYGGFGDGLLKDTKILEKLGLVYEDTYWYGKAWTEGLLMEDLEEGKRAIWNTHDPLFTGSGHYIELELKDGKLWLNDPNGENYMSMNPTLKDILSNGIAPKDLKKYGGHFYIFDVADSTETTKTQTVEKSDDELLNEILEKSSESIPKTNTTPTRTTVTPTTTPTRTTTTTTTTTSTRTRTTTSSEKPIEKVPEVPLFNQNDYADVPYGIKGNYGNLAEDGCAIVAYSMVLTYLFDDYENYTPEKLAEMYGGTYGGAWGTGRQIFDETPQDYGLEVEGLSAWDGFGKSDKVMEALANGQPVIALVGTVSGLTSKDSGHYVVLTGLTEDGKIKVNDPNGNNYNKSSLQDDFENGFNEESFSRYGTYWIFPEKDTSNLQTSTTQSSNTGSNTNTGTKTDNNYTNVANTATRTTTNVNTTPSTNTGSATNNNSTNVGNTNTRTTTKENTTTRTTTADYKPSYTQINGMDYSRTTTMNIVQELAKEAGVDTNGKSSSEIIEELVQIYGIETTKIGDITYNTEQALQEWYKDRGSNKNPPEADIETRYYDITDPENKYNMGGLAYTDENGNQKGLLHKLGFKDVVISVREDGVFVATGYTPEGKYFENKVLVAADLYHSETNPDGKYQRGQEVMTSLGPGMVLDYCGKADWDYDDKQGIVDFEIATAWKTEPYATMLKEGTLPVVEWTEEGTVAKTEYEILSEIMQKASNTSKVELGTTTSKTRTTTTSTINTSSEENIEKVPEEPLLNKNEKDSNKVSETSGETSKKEENASTNTKGETDNSSANSKEANTQPSEKTNTTKPSSENNNTQSSSKPSSNDTKPTSSSKPSSGNSSSSASSSSSGNSTPSSSNSSSSNSSTVTPSNPSTDSTSGNTSNIIKCTPEAILEAAQNVKEDTSYSTYISSVLYESGYISEGETHLYKDYTLDMIRKEFEGFGWETVTDINNLQSGDIIFTESTTGNTVYVYGGNNKWYTMGNTEGIGIEILFGESENWCAYRPSVGLTL